MRDAAADSTDANLKEMSRLVDAFPQVIGNWTVSEVAWRARATVMRLDELAQEMGLPACGAATWRLPSWVVLTDEAGGTPLPPAEYSAQVAELCASTFGGFASSDEAGTLANALDSVNAQRSLDEFSRGIDDHTPPPEHVDEHLEILLVLQSLDAVLPDVPTTLGREKAERVSTLSTRMGEALTSLDAIC